MTQDTKAPRRLRLRPPPPPHPSPLPLHARRWSDDSPGATCRFRRGRPVLVLQPGATAGGGAPRFRHVRHISECLQVAVPRGRERGRSGGGGGAREVVGFHRGMFPVFCSPLSSLLLSSHLFRFSFLRVFFLSFLFSSLLSICPLSSLLSPLPLPHPFSLSPFLPPLLRLHARQNPSSLLHESVHLSSSTQCTVVVSLVLRMYIESVLSPQV